MLIILFLVHVNVLHVRLSHTSSKLICQKFELFRFNS